MLPNLSFQPLIEIFLVHLHNLGKIQQKRHFTLKYPVIRPYWSVNFVITLMYFMLAGVVVINTGGHLSTASAASSVAAAAAGTPTGLIIPHSALVGNSLASLQQHQQQPPGTASGGSGSPSPTSGDKFLPYITN